MKQKLVPIISIVIGIIAFFLTYNYLHQKEQEFQKMKADFFKGAVKVDVLVARIDIPSGTLLKATDLRKTTVYKTEVNDRAVALKDGTKILGRKMMFAIKEGNQILWSDIEGGQDSSDGLASLVNMKMRAISLNVGGASAVSGMVQPNDRVDVLGTFSMTSKKTPGEMETVTLTILQDVTILATGQKMAKQQVTGKRTDTGYNTVTIEVTPREAELLVFAQQMRGSLTLSLRNPTDVYYEEDLPSVNFEHMETKLPELNMYRQKNIRRRTTPGR